MGNFSARKVVAKVYEEMEAARDRCLLNAPSYDRLVTLPHQQTDVGFVCCDYLGTESSIRPRLVTPQSCGQTPPNNLPSSDISQQSWPPRQQTAPVFLSLRQQRSKSWTRTYTELILLRTSASVLVWGPLVPFHSVLHQSIPHCSLRTDERLFMTTPKANGNTVPNGGYTASCLLSAGSLHLASRNQPDAFTAHFEYPGRAVPGAAIVTVEEVKLGVKLSTLHLTLWQGGLLSEAPWINPKISRRTVLAYTTLTDQRAFSGITLETGWEVSPAAALPSPLPDFAALKTSKTGDGFWEEQTTPPSGALRSMHNWRFFLPQSGPLQPGVVDMWVCRSNGERILQGGLPYLVDSFPYNIHTYLMSPDLRALLETTRKDGGDAKAKDMHQRNEQRAGLWYPTIVMNLEVKTAIPEEGLEWVAVRVQSKLIKDGKFDTDVMVRDKDGEVVALSQQVSMIVSMERNTAKRGSAKPSL